jgi:hypothetical protein
VLSAVVAQTSATTTEAVGIAKVTYVSGGTVYVDSGRNKGLRDGDSLRVVRGKKIVTTLVVEHLSELRAACAIKSGPAPVVGDVVRLPIRGEEDDVGAEPIYEAGETAMVVSAASANVEPDPAESAGAEAIGGSAEAVPAPAISADIGLAHVTHLDSSHVYIDSGENKQLRGGDQLKVVRGSTTVAVLEVTDIASDRAACNILEEFSTVEAGDFVRLPIRIGDDDSAPAREFPSAESTMIVHSAPTIPSPAPPRSGSKQRLRGRVGVRYLIVQDRTENGSEFSQPALDMRLDGNGLAAGHLGLAVDVRSRRTYRTPAVGEGEAEDSARVYRAALSIHDRRGRHRVTAGRQFSPSLATVSVFDGVLADLNRASWSIGVFGGTQPDPISYGFSQEITEYGGFVQLHNRPQSNKHWSVTSGAVGSYQSGEVNREFAYLQALFTGPRLSLFATQEVDFNRDWKILDGEDQFSFTSTYLHIGYRVSRGFSLRGGYDNRRNIRLYRDHITPETEFDDSFRRGTWVGFTQRFANRYRLGLDGKTNSSETAGTANSYTLTLGANRISRANLSLNYRGTFLTNERLEGWLHSLNTSVSAGRRTRLSAIGGLREDTNLVDETLSQQLVWYGLAVDLSLGRHWFVQLSGERTEGRLEKNDQGYFSTTYRF